jgi:glycosyltransferase involved in cell wall biosynthesis
MIGWWLWGAIELSVWSWYSLQMVLGLRHIPDLARESRTTGGPPVVLRASCPQLANAPSLLIVVPARNEEHAIEACLRSLANSTYSNLRVIAVNDRSTDATGAIMDRLATEFPDRIHVLHITELPAGWLGKTHAMWRGAASESSDYILFTDGDVVFAPQTLTRAMKYVVESDADHFVLSPTFELQSFGETMMIALFQILFVFEHRPWRAIDPKSKEHIGVGAFNLVRRGAYEAIGTYAALRLAVLDDMKLGERIKLSGLRQRFAYGHNLVRIRWAEGYSGFIHGLTKNAFAIANFRLGKLLYQLCGVSFVLLGPYAGAAFAPTTAKWSFLLAIAIIWSHYVHMRIKTGVSVLYSVTHPFAAISFLFVMLRSGALAIMRGGIEWRGTKYSLAEIRTAQQ